MNLFNIKVKYTDIDFKYEDTVDMLVATSSEGSLSDNVQSLYFKTLSDENDYLSGNHKIEILSCRQLDLGTLTDFYEYTMSIAGDYVISDSKPIKEVLNTLTDNDPTYFANRVMYLQGCSIDGQVRIYHHGSCNKDALRAINSCVQRGIDPFGY